LSQIVIDWKGQRAEHWPKYIPDLYLGEPVVIAAKLPKLGAEVGIHGWRGGKHWAVDFKLEGGSTHSGIDRLFARRKIDSLNSRLLDGADADAVREEIVAIGLNHHLVTKHTSLVAVEQVVSRPQGESLTSAAIPTNLPKGWIMEDIWAQRGQWDEEMKKIRAEVERTREEASYRVAEAKMKGKASVAELRKMQEELRLEEERRLAEAAAKASSSTSYASPSTPSAEASYDAAEATVSADTGTYAATSAATTAPKRTATAQGPGALPKTGTGAALFLLIGLLLLGLALVLRTRRWTFA
jgi:LPXTG-motif cell wall-anchored protein